METIYDGAPRCDYVTDRRVKTYLVTTLIFGRLVEVTVQAHTVSDAVRQVITIGQNRLPFYGVRER